MSLPSLKTTNTISDEAAALGKEHLRNLPPGKDYFNSKEAKTNKLYSIEDMVVKGITIGKDKSALAFINNEIVKIGDSISGYNVDEIQKDKVILSKGSQIFTLRLSGD